MASLSHAVIEMIQLSEGVLAMHITKRTMTVTLDNGTELEIQRIRARGFRADISGFYSEDNLCLRTVCSPVRLETDNYYWVALIHPEFADQSHKCAQLYIEHPDWLRAEISHISEGSHDELASPVEMHPVQHVC